MLDGSQLAAVKIEPSLRQLVVAGPGSGKTEVVSNLIEHLVHDENIDPVDGILVISFSNAAVFAAGARLRSNDIGSVTVQTMDSLAGEIIRDLWDSDPRDLRFDKRIQLAAELLSDVGWDRLDRLEHFIVDEVQDIVGVRADFLLAIIRSLPNDAGFSLLGDPAQGIYDWQVHIDNKPISPTTSLELLAQIQRMKDVQVKYLTGQYRARSRDAMRAVALRDSVLKHDSNSAIDVFFADLVAGSAVAETALHAARWRGTTAFLTANNGQALLTAGSLAEVGLGVEVRRSAQQRVLASWIARLVADCPTIGITRDEIEERAHERVPDITVAKVWRALRSVSSGQGREVNIADLARGLLRPRPLVPDLIEPIQSSFIVSTVHRAKGLEFDNVVYVDFPDKPWLDGGKETLDGGDEARRMFVALSRARDMIVRANGPDDQRLRRLPQHSATPPRWYLGGRQRWMTSGIELRVDDLDRSAPPGLDREAVQRHITTRVKPGDLLQLNLNTDKSTLLLPVWDLIHEEHVVGTTSVAFGESIVSRIGTLERKKRTGWPRLSGARVDGVATISGPPQQGIAGRRGLWLAPVCASMLSIDWKGDSNV